MTLLLPHFEIVFDGRRCRAARRTWLDHFERCRRFLMILLCTVQLCLAPMTLQLSPSGNRWKCNTWYRRYRRHGPPLSTTLQVVGGFLRTLRDFCFYVGHCFTWTLAFFAIMRGVDVVLLWNCSETARKLLGNCSETARKCDWTIAFCFRQCMNQTYLEMLWFCSEIALKLLWNCSETALKLLWNCSKTVWKSH